MSLNTRLASPLAAVLAGLLGIGGAVATSVQADAAPNRLSTATLAGDLLEDLRGYLRDRGQPEHVSAAVLSVSLRGRPSTIDLAAGTTRFGGNRPVAADSIVQIGSNTKAFTSVLILRLEAEHRLSIDDTVGHWLPQYPQWASVTIKQLLNMTSGIATYDAQPAFLADYAADPHAYFPKERLISYVRQLPPTAGYSYSNTNYVLAEMIIEKATGDSYAHLLSERLIRPLRLHDTYYGPHRYPRYVASRQPAGYFAIPGVPGLTPGTDVSRNTLSWARSAGAILATTHAMTVWERLLYGDTLLPAKQRAELFSLVSTTTGKPIDRTTDADRVGFGLGVQQTTSPTLGTFWSYEGGTFGFRTFHLYLPSSGVIFAVSLNSQTTDDRIGTLAVSIVDTLQAHGLA